MIMLELKPCCYQCNLHEIYVDENRYGPVTTSVIYCNHHKVCKTYLEAEEASHDRNSD